MYTFQSRIRYSEIDARGQLRLNALINYFQDCSTFQSEDRGVGLAWLKEHHRVWVLSSWQIQILRYPILGEQVTVGTCPYRFSGALGYRNFWMQDAEGNYLAKANSLWALLDTTTWHPVKIQPEEIAAYGQGTPLDMPEVKRKIRLPEGGNRQEPVLIRPDQLDTNHHVNNGQYVELAQNYVPEDMPVHWLQVEYKKQALLGDLVVPRTIQETDGWLVSLEDKDGQPYAIVRLLEKMEEVS